MINILIGIIGKLQRSVVSTLASLNKNKMVVETDFSWILQFSNSRYIDLNWMKMIDTKVSGNSNFPNF